MLTYSSHYFPALYFAIIAVCQIYDFLFNRFAALGLPQRPAIGGTVAVVYLALSVTAFSLYAPLSYGNMWTRDECKRVKLFDTWDWDCNNFLTSVSHLDANNRRKLI
jgi:dolichyl-phosphate-mannose-protein mannosyltransferase